MAARQTDAEQAAMAARRRIAGMRTGFRSRTRAARQRLLRAGFRHSPQASVVAGGFGCFARLLESGVFRS